MRLALHTSLANAAWFSDKDIAQTYKICYQDTQVCNFTETSHVRDQSLHLEGYLPRPCSS